jgi:hypothetical protein
MKTRRVLTPASKRAASLAEIKVDTLRRLPDIRLYKQHGVSARQTNAYEQGDQDAHPCFTTRRNQALAKTVIQHKSPQKV